MATPEVFEIRLDALSKHVRSLLKAMNKKDSIESKPVKSKPSVPVPVVAPKTKKATKKATASAPPPAEVPAIVKRGRGRPPKIPAIIPSQ